MASGRMTSFAAISVCITVSLFVCLTFGSAQAASVDGRAPVSYDGNGDYEGPSDRQLPAPLASAGPPPPQHGLRSAATHSEKINWNGGQLLLNGNPTSRNLPLNSPSKSAPKSEQKEENNARNSFHSSAKGNSQLIRKIIPLPGDPTSNRPVKVKIQRASKTCYLKIHRPQRKKSHSVAKRSLDSMGRGSLFNRALESVGGGYMFNRALDSMGRGTLLEKKGLDSLGSGSSMFNRALDSLGRDSLFDRRAALEILEYPALGDGESTRASDSMGRGLAERRISQGILRSPSFRTHRVKRTIDSLGRGYLFSREILNQEVKPDSKTFGGTPVNVGVNRTIEIKKPAHIKSLSNDEDTSAKLDVENDTKVSNSNLETRGLDSLGRGDMFVRGLDSLGRGDMFVRGLDSLGRGDMFVRGLDSLGRGDMFVRGLDSLGRGNMFARGTDSLGTEGTHGKRLDSLGRGDMFARGLDSLGSGDMFARAANPPSSGSMSSRTWDHQGKGRNVPVKTGKNALNGGAQTVKIIGGIPVVFGHPDAKKIISSKNAARSLFVPKEYHLKAVVNNNFGNNETPDNEDPPIEDPPNKVVKDLPNVFTQGGAADFGPALASESVLAANGRILDERALDSLGSGVLMNARNLQGPELADAADEATLRQGRIGKRLDVLSGMTIGAAKRNFDEIGHGMMGFAKKSFDEIGHGNMGFAKRNFDEIGHGHMGFAKKSFDEIGHGVMGFAKRPSPGSQAEEDNRARDLNDLERSILRYLKQKRNFDEIGHGMMGFAKRNFDEIGHGHMGFAKKSFDEIGHGNMGFAKKSFDEIGHGNMGFAKKSFDEIGHGNMGFAKKNFDEIGHSSMGFLKKRSVDEQQRIRSKSSAVDATNDNNKP